MSILGITFIITSRNKKNKNVQQDTQETIENGTFLFQINENTTS
jgi:hypothetical protein